MTTYAEVYNLLNVYHKPDRTLLVSAPVGDIVDDICYFGNKPIATAAAKKALQQLRDNKLTFSKEGDIIIRD